MHAFMIELGQLVYWYPKKNTNCEILCTLNGEFSCDITDSGIVPSREGDIQNFALIVLLNGLSKFSQNITVGFLKLLSIYSPNFHIVVWGNFPFKLKGRFSASTIKYDDLTVNKQ